MTEVSAGGQLRSEAYTARQKSRVTAEVSGDLAPELVWEPGSLKVSVFACISDSKESQQMEDPLSLGFL